MSEQQPGPMSIEELESALLHADQEIQELKNKSEIKSRILDAQRLIIARMRQTLDAAGLSYDAVVVDLWRRFPK